MCVFSEWAERTANGAAESAGRSQQQLHALKEQSGARGNLRKSNLEGIAARGVPSEAENISRICQWPLFASHSLFLSA